MIKVSGMLLHDQQQLLGVVGGLDGFCAALGSCNPGSPIIIPAATAAGLTTPAITSATPPSALLLPALGPLPPLPGALPPDLCPGDLLCVYLFASS